MISIGKTPEDLKLELAQRFATQRLMKNLSRQSLSEISGVPARTIKEFETTGKISMNSFIYLSFALDKIEEIESLYKIEDPKKIEDLRNRNRLRGRK